MQGHACAYGGPKPAWQLSFAEKRQRCTVTKRRLGFRSGGSVVGGQNEARANRKRRTASFDTTNENADRVRIPPRVHRLERDCAEIGPQCVQEFAEAIGAEDHRNGAAW